MNVIRRHSGWIAFAAALAVACPVTAEEKPVEPPASPPKAFKRLDLRVPDVTELYSQEQIRGFLASTRSDGYLEEVEVQDTKLLDSPAVWRGLAAPFWAITQPAQAWRIFAPIPADRIHGADVQPAAQAFARDPFRP